MGPGQLSHQPITLGCQHHPDDARVFGIGEPADQPSRLCPVQELHCAVMPQQQVIGQVTDGGREVAGMPFNRHQELVLGVGEPGRARLILAPVLETTQAHAESQQMLEVMRG